jgi:hypothetical protein
VRLTGATAVEAMLVSIRDVLARFVSAEGLLGFAQCRAYAAGSIDSMVILVVLVPLVIVMLRASVILMGVPLAAQVV